MTEKPRRGSTPVHKAGIVALIVSAILAVIVASVVVIYFDATGGIPHGADITEADAAAEVDALMDEALALVDPALIERTDVSDDNGYCGNNFNDAHLKFQNRTAGVYLVLAEGVSSDTVMQTFHDAYEKRGPDVFFSKKDDSTRDERTWTISVDSEKESNGAVTPGLYFRAGMDDITPQVIRIEADSDCYLLP